MKRTFLALALAVVPALAVAQSVDVSRALPDAPAIGTAANGDRTQLEASAARALARAGIDVDPRTLTLHQLGAVHMSASSGESSDRWQRLRQIVS
jgi:hypothetical protein